MAATKVANTSTRAGWRRGARPGAQVSAFIVGRAGLICARLILTSASGQRGQVTRPRESNDNDYRAAHLHARTRVQTPTADKQLIWAPICAQISRQTCESIQQQLQQRQQLKSIICLPRQAPSAPAAAINLSHKSDALIDGRALIRRAPIGQRRELQPLAEPAASVFASCAPPLAARTRGLNIGRLRALACERLCPIGRASFEPLGCFSGASARIKFVSGLRAGAACVRPAGRQLDHDSRTMIMIRARRWPCIVLLWQAGGQPGRSGVAQNSNQSNLRRPQGSPDLPGREERVARRSRRGAIVAEATNSIARWRRAGGRAGRRRRRAQFADAAGAQLNLKLVATAAAACRASWRPASRPALRNGFCHSLAWDRGGRPTHL